MDFKRVIFPRETFCRFDHSFEKSLELQSRYCVLVGTFKYANSSCSKHVTLYFGKYKDDSEFPVDSHDLAGNGTNNVGEDQFIKSRNIYTFVNMKRKEQDESSILIVESRFIKEIFKLSLTKLHFVLVAKDDEEKENISKELSGLNNVRIAVTLKENSLESVNNLLERTALAPLKYIAENCFDMHQNYVSSLEPLEKNKAQRIRDNKARTKREAKSTGNSCLPKMDSSYMQQSGQSCENVETTLPKSTTTCTGKQSRNKRQGKPVALTKIQSEPYKVVRRFQPFTITPENGHKTGKRRKRDISEHLSVPPLKRSLITNTDQSTDSENPEQLLEAILALYGMSNVPDADKPNVPEHNCSINKEMRKELFRISPSVKRVGFRYRTFCVYAVKPKSHTDEILRNEEISTVLNKYGIFVFEIVPCTEETFPFMHVGAKIQARSGTFISLRSRKVSSADIKKGGTLGCFANKNGSGSKYGLFSKHVTEGCEDIFHVDNGDDKQIGYMIGKTNKQEHGGLDISAAIMYEHIDENGTKFMDTRRNLLKGTLHEYHDDTDDKICRSGQSVHIYGASSNPGKGEITMTAVDVGLTSPLIQIEDKICDDGKPFAVKGDSGAIVCVEDPDRKTVHALSMVMGSQDASTERRTYLTLPLSKGLQQLGNDTDSRFDLC